MLYSQIGINEVTNKMLMYVKEKITRVFQKAPEGSKSTSETIMDHLESGDVWFDPSNVQPSTSLEEPVEFEGGTMKSLEIKTISLQEMSASLGIECPLPNENILSSVCDHNGGVITIKNGLKISIPRGAISVGDIITFYVAVSLYSSFMLPLVDHLASPYYWIGVTGSYNFQKPIEVEFEHYGACNPSHYRLLVCKDNDKTYTMQPAVNKVLEFTALDDRSLCRFQTYHFCSYCLSHTSEDDKCKNSDTYRIAALYLIQKPVKPHNESLSDYKVQIWFTFNAAKCLNRAKELYEKEDMENTESQYVEACCDKNSTNVFILEYNRTVDGWDIDHIPPNILAKKVNFYNYYDNNAERLRRCEEAKLFPPRFSLHIKNTESCNTHLFTNVSIHSYNNEKDKELLTGEPVKFIITRSRYSSSKPNYDPPKHSCAKNKPRYSSSEPNYDPPKHSCAKNKPKLKQLLRHVQEFGSRWNYIAVFLDIPEGQIEIIKKNHPNDVEQSSFDMLTFWLHDGICPCWCHFIDALYTAGLRDLAKQVDDRFRQLCTNEDEAQYSIKNDCKINIHAYKLKQLKRIPDMCDNNRIHDRQFKWVFKSISERSWSDVIMHLFEDGGADVLEDISHISDSREKRDKICEAFLKESNPSWSKVCRALKEADLDSEEAEIVEMVILSSLEQAGRSSDQTN